MQPDTPEMLRDNVAEMVNKQLQTHIGKSVERRGKATKRPPSSANCHAPGSFPVSHSCGEIWMTGKVIQAAIDLFATRKAQQSGEGRKNPKWARICRFSPSSVRVEGGASRLEAWLS